MRTNRMELKSNKFEGLEVEERVEESVSKERP